MFGSKWKVHEKKYKESFWNILKDIHGTLNNPSDWTLKMFGIGFITECSRSKDIPILDHVYQKKLLVKKYPKYRGWNIQDAEDCGLEIASGP